ncbi:MAG: hypothetical protein KatS3mg043_0559 [Rhodothermaceae bacterium]|nr:MAG: hypothetical protein KatS3mg043_0559 [Rhodothermaceae bacterium]
MQAAGIVSRFGPGRMKALAAFGGGTRSGRAGCAGHARWKLNRLL